MSQFKLACQDLKKTFLQSELWLHLGSMDVKQRYRRSVLGPWWISLSLLIFVMMMGAVFSRLFHQQLDEYMLFFTAGFVFWTFLSGSVIESADLFKVHAGFIKQTSLPYHTYIFKFFVRQSVCLFHNLVVFVLVCLFFKFTPGWKVVLMIPGFFLFLLNVYWICLCASVVCTRFRDMVPIITSCVQVAFFITPISWMPKLLDQNPGVLRYNPLTYLLDIVRSPLLGQEPAVISWVVSFCLALVGCFVSFMLFSKHRARIAFWVD